jgi:putative ABC transport system permease protein
VFEVATMADRVRYVLAPQLAGTWLLGIFSTLALVVAAVGIYGVVAYAVSQRTREIGIRMALGARRSSVIGLVVAHNLAFVLAGIIAGMLLAIPLARVMTTFLYGVGTTDPVTFASTSVTMLLVALIASIIPARRTTRIDPLTALRAEG